MIDSLIQYLDLIEQRTDIRVLVLRSEGKHFSAGADLAWMQRMIQHDYVDNVADARKLAVLMYKLNHLNQPTLALVQGAAYGGAVGLLACCDMVIASADAQFCLSEVKIGLIPAVISPYVIRAIGERQARRYSLTAEVFDAHQAQQLGLVHQSVADSQALALAAQTCLHQLLRNGTLAMQAAKSLILSVSQQPLTPAVIEQTIEAIARIRISPEGQAGLTAFLHKRPAPWQQEPTDVS
jgi:methylglutaconyl-CoA hydratase